MGGCHTPTQRRLSSRMRGRGGRGHNASWQPRCWQSWLPESDVRLAIFFSLTVPSVEAGWDQLTAHSDHLP